MKAFPGTVKPAAADHPYEPAGSHFRYPEDQFKVQRRAAHPLPRPEPDASSSSGSSFWDVPSDPTVQAGTGTDAAPSRRTTCSRAYPVRSRARRRPAFQLTSALVFKSRQIILSSYMSVSSDPGTYGKITVLQLPSGHADPRSTAGAGTAFISSPTVSSRTSACSDRRGQSTDRLRQPVDVAGGGRPAVRRTGVRRTCRAGVVLPAAGHGCSSSYGNRIGYDSERVQGALDRDLRRRRERGAQRRYRASTPRAARRRHRTRRQLGQSRNWRPPPPRSRAR